jgi:hypothetical protein
MESSSPPGGLGGEPKRFVTVTSSISGKDPCGPVVSYATVLATQEPITAGALTASPRGSTRLPNGAESSALEPAHRPMPQARRAASSTAKVRLGAASYRFRRAERELVSAFMSSSGDGRIRGSSPGSNAGTLADAPILKEGAHVDLSRRPPSNAPVSRWLQSSPPRRQDARKGRWGGVGTRAELTPALRGRVRVAQHAPELQEGPLWPLWFVRRLRRTRWRRPAAARRSLC